MDKSTAEKDEIVQFVIDFVKSVFSLASENAGISGTKKYQNFNGNEMVKIQVHTTFLTSPAV